MRESRTCGSVRGARDETRVPTAPAGCAAADRFGDGTRGVCMRRREFLTLLGAAAGWPVGARAQQSKPAPRVGVLMAVAENDPDSRRRIAAFREGLRALGWVEGQNVAIEYRWAAGEVGRIQQYAEELVALKPDVILANSTPVISALKKLTKTIPIVCALVNDPVGLGFVASLSRPGGNITGFTFI